MMSPLFQSIIRSAIGLGLFAMVTAGLIALTQQLTADDIRIQQEQARAGALLEVVPGRFHDNHLPGDTFTVEPSPLLGLASPGTGYRARRDGTVSAVILPAVTRDGYAGPIRLLMGIRHDGELLGVRVLEHQETPGLGDQIETRKSDWILGFDGLSLDQLPPEAWQVRKRGGEFDQFTGATITPDAVVVAVRKGLEYFQQQRPALLSDAPVVRATTAGAHSHE